MASEDRDQFSSTVGIRVKSPTYLYHLRAIFAMLNIRNVHGVREAVDIGVRQMIKKQGRKEDTEIYEKHLEAMDRS